MNHFARLAVYTASAALSIPAVVGIATTAHAHEPTCDPNTETYFTTAERGDVVATHGMTLHLPADVETTVSGPMPEVQVLRAQVTGNGSAAKVLAEADATAQHSGQPAHLALDGAETPRGAHDFGDVDVHHAQPQARELVAFHGYRVWSGTWTRSLCGGNGLPTATHSGTWTSYATSAYSGDVDCASPSAAWLARVCDDVRDAGN